MVTDGVFGRSDHRGAPQWVQVRWRSALRAPQEAQSHQVSGTVRIGVSGARSTPQTVHTAASAGMYTPQTVHFH